MSTLLLLLVPGLPAAAAATIVTGRCSARAAARMAIVASNWATVAAVAVLVGVTRDARWSAVANDGGDLMAGLTADRVGAVLALLTVGVAVVVQSFAARALDGDPRAPRFFALASTLAAATAVVALASTLLMLAVAWVVAGWALIGLLTHRRGWGQAIDAARRTRRWFVAGDVALASAVIVAFVAIGDVDLRDTAAIADRLGGSTIASFDALGVIALLLVIAGAFRSALVPAHRWLPATVAAPTPVSALLHAGVVNGAGILVIRTADITGASALAMWVLFACGAATAVLATAVMLVRTDVKGALAWSTAGQMGFMAVQLAVGAFAAALFHVVGHAMYKAAMFLGAGGAISAHTRRRHLPHPERAFGRAAGVALAGMISAASMAAAFVLFDPHLSTAATILLAGFGWVTATQLVHGWLRATEFGAWSIAIGVATGATAPLAYVGGVTLFERFVAPAVPFEVAGQVPAAALVVVLAAGVVALLVLCAAPRSVARRWRDLAYGALVGFGTPPVAAATRRHVASATAVERAGDRQPDRPRVRHRVPTLAAPFRA